MNKYFYRISLKIFILLSVVIIILPLFMTFLYLYNGFKSIEEVASITKSQYLPRIVDKQRMLNNIEILRRQVLLIHCSGSPEDIRQARVVARALLAEAAFDRTPDIHDRINNITPALAAFTDLKEKYLIAEKELQRNEAHLERMLGRFSALTEARFPISAVHDARRLPSSSGIEADAENDDAAESFKIIERICSSTPSLTSDCKKFYYHSDLVSRNWKTIQNFHAESVRLREQIEQSLDALLDYVSTAEVLKISSDMGHVGNIISYVRLKFFIFLCGTAVLLFIIFCGMYYNMINPLIRMTDFLNDIRLGKQIKKPPLARIKEIQQLMDVMPILHTAIERLNMRTDLLMRERDEYRKLSMLDHLTNIQNRLALEEQKKSDIPELPLAVVMIDIDFFKKYNDTLGHIKGDEALITLAQIIKDNLHRHADRLYRYGGEEFIIVLPGVDPDTVATVSERILESVRRHAVPHPASPFGILTVSMGCACRLLGDLTPLGDLIDQADKALYTSKREGRNRVSLFPSSRTNWRG